MIPELRDLRYEDRLKERGLTTPETRRLRGDQIEVLKILNVYETFYRNIFFSLKKDSRTRGHEITLLKNQCRMDIRKYSFPQRTIDECIRLFTDCINLQYGLLPWMAILLNLQQLAVVSNKYHPVVDINMRVLRRMTQKRKR